MASRTISSSLAFLLVLNLLFFTITTAHGCGCPSTPIPNPSPKPKPKPKPKPTPSPSPGAAKCPIDVLKLGVCGDVLGSLINLGTPPTEQCCSVIQGLLDLEAAVCLCTAIKANIIGINLNVSVSLSLLLNVCGKNVPPGFQCPN